MEKAKPEVISDNLKAEIEDKEYLNKLKDLE